MTSRILNPHTNARLTITTTLLLNTKCVYFYVKHFFERIDPSKRGSLFGGFLQNFIAQQQQTHGGRWIAPGHGNLRRVPGQNQVPAVSFALLLRQ